jgi:hypothetical protein
VTGGTRPPRVGVAIATSTSWEAPCTPPSTTSSPHCTSPSTSCWVRAAGWAGPPKLSDAELVCLAVAQVLLGARSERHWLRFAHDRLGHLFPYLPGQAGYNKRLRAAAHLVVVALRDLAVRSPSWCDGFRLLDATPLPCGASRETVKRSALWPHAGYGHDPSHGRWYWGFKL